MSLEIFRACVAGRLPWLEVTGGVVSDFSQEAVLEKALAVSACQIASADRYYPFVLKRLEHLERFCKFLRGHCHLIVR